MIDPVTNFGALPVTAGLTRGATAAFEGVGSVIRVRYPGSSCGSTTTFQRERARGRVYPRLAAQSS